MIIDAPQPRDIPQLRRLWTEAFGDPASFLDGFFATGFSPDRCRCLYSPEEPAAALYWFDCFFQDRRYAYIYAVATLEVHRGKGFCRLLMEDTHRHLLDLGYCGAVLVPGSRELFRLYEKLGYRSFCPMEETTVLPQTPAISSTPLSPESYVNLRKEKLPAGGLLQDISAIRFLSTYCRLYRAGDSLFALARENDHIYFQEYLGDPALLPGIIAGFGATAATVRLPGGHPYAMHLPLVQNAPPAYFGIPLD